MQIVRGKIERSDLFRKKDKYTEIVYHYNFNSKDYFTRYLHYPNSAKKDEIICYRVYKARGDYFTLNLETNEVEFLSTKSLFSGSTNFFYDFRDDEYCGACQSSPCMCSDPW